MFLWAGYANNAPEFAACKINNLNGGCLVKVIDNPARDAISFIINPL